jgi:hypothetical protein
LIVIVVRVEYGFDNYVDLPIGPKFEHVGHTIRITPRTSSAQSQSNLFQDVALQSSPPEQQSEISYLTTSVVAFKFGRSVAEPKDKKRVSKLLEKDDHEMRSYLHALEQFTHLCSPWVSNFFGEDGGGIVSSHNEERFVS